MELAEGRRIDNRGAVVAVVVVAPATVVVTLVSLVGIVLCTCLDLLRPSDNRSFFGSEGDVILVVAAATAAVGGCSSTSFLLLLF